MSTQPPYTVRLTGPAARHLAERLPEKAATAVGEFLMFALAENPHRVGKQLRYMPYAGTWSARRGAYRVLYEIDEDQRVILVTTIEHRGEVYRPR